MTQFLPPNLLALFAPRDPIPYLPPPDKLPHEKKNVHNYVGIGQFVKGNFEDPKDTPPPTRVETRVERLERKKRDKEEQVAYKLEQEIALWDPTAAPDDAVTTDPFKTLFVGRINNYTSENKIRREFESYGPIKTIKMVHDKESNKPKGYCFIEFEHERDMHSAYKRADGKKLDGRRVLVDVERGRTVKGWLPRRLGGGLGGTRRGGPDVNVRHSGREDGGGRDRERYDRSRSRDREKRRKRSRSRSRDRSERKRSRRSRSRERERRRSRSRDKKKSRRGSRSRSRDRRDRKDRERDSRKGRLEEGDISIKEEPVWKDEINVKEEPMDDNAGYGGYDDGYEDYDDPNVRKIKEERGYDERKPQIVDNGYYDNGNYD